MNSNKQTYHIWKQLSQSLLTQWWAPRLSIMGRKACYHGNGYQGTLTLYTHRIWNKHPENITPSGTREKRPLSLLVINCYILFLGFNLSPCVSRPSQKADSLSIYRVYKCQSCDFIGSDHIQSEYGHEIWLGSPDCFLEGIRKTTQDTSHRTEAMKSISAFLALWLYWAFLWLDNLVKPVLIT